MLMMVIQHAQAKDQTESNQKFNQPNALIMNNSQVFKVCIYKDCVATEQRAKQTTTTQQEYKSSNLFDQVTLIIPILKK